MSPHLYWVKFYYTLKQNAWKPAGLNRIDCSLLLTAKLVKFYFHLWKNSTKPMVSETWICFINMYIVFIFHRSVTKKWSSKEWLLPTQHWLYRVGDRCWHHLWVFEKSRALHDAVFWNEELCCVYVWLVLACLLFEDGICCKIWSKRRQIQSLWRDEVLSREKWQLMCSNRNWTICHLKFKCTSTTKPDVISNFWKRENYTYLFCSKMSWFLFDNRSFCSRLSG